MVGQERLFVDRKEAGIELGKILADRYKDHDVLVLGIPRGGVEVASEVAKLLNAELSIVIAKKLPKPGMKEIAIGAVSEGEQVYLTQLGKNLNDYTVQKIVNEQFREIQSRILRFRRGNPLPDMEGRTVILVDDGIATGSTFVPTISLCKKRKAKNVVVAAPVSGTNYAPEINLMADEIAIIDQPEDYYAVGQVYEDFHELTDEEVCILLDNYAKV